MIRLVKRPQPSAAWSYGAPILAVLATVIVGGQLFGMMRGPDINWTFYSAIAWTGNTFAGAALLMWAIGRFLLGKKRDDPLIQTAYFAGYVSIFFGTLFGFQQFAAFDLEAIEKIFYEPLFGQNAFYYRPQLLVKGAPLVLIAIGLSLGFRAGIWNIGAEGQYIMGALCGAGVALALHPLESAWIFPLMVLAGAFGGWAWAMIPALLKTRFGTNEILVSLMLVYVAEQFLASMALGLMKNPEGFGFPGSRNLQQYPSAHNAEIVAGTGMHWGVVAALIAVIAAYVLLTRHRLGFAIRVTGEAPRAARFAGVNPSRLVIFCLGTAGMLAGLAGLFEVAGPAGRVTIDFNVGYGFTAIIVAFLGRLNPIGILMAGGLMALTYIGGDIAQSNLGLPAAAIQVFQGMLLFFLLAIDLFTNYRIGIIGKEVG